MTFKNEICKMIESYSTVWFVDIGLEKKKSYWAV